MKFNSKGQENAYHKAIKRSFKAAAFDIDGTLTKLAKLHIPHKLLLKLGELAAKVPFIICSGRDIEHIKGKVKSICGAIESDSQILDGAANLKRKKSLRKIYVVCENGGSAFRYDCKTNSYSPLFEIPWPDKIITVDELARLLDKKLPWKIQVKARKQSIVLYYPPFFYIFPLLIRHLSALLANSTRRILKKEGLADFFHIEDSGIGTVVIPKDSGKGKSIARISKLLKISLQDFLVVGDMPEEGKNDCEFLCGQYGTAFSVGKQTVNIFPLPVYGANGKKLVGPEGTYYLLNQLNFDA